MFVLFFFIAQLASLAPANEQNKKKQTFLISPEGSQGPGQPRLGQAEPGQPRPGQASPARLEPEQLIGNPTARLAPERSLIRKNASQQED